MRNDLSFASGGLTCRGWFYAGSGKGPRPLIVMSHGVTAVKEQHLARFAERFATEGFAVIVFDYRYLGSSDGEPRGRVIPHLQHEDLRAALRVRFDRAAFYSPPVCGLTTRASVRKS